MVNNWSIFIRRWLFPPQCRLCLAAGDDDLDICRPLPAGQTGRCARCLAEAPAVDACHALFAYRPPIDGWIQALKFNRDLAIAHALGTLLARHPATASYGRDWQLLAVPLHRGRLRQRGYNQALELARPLLKTGLRKARCDCRRVRATAAQSTLNKHRRRRNLRGAFQVGTALQGENILVIDDVVTTGATLDELAVALKRSGAGRVEALVVARTLLER